MATQEETGIPFAIEHKQQNFRLLELPPDFLQLITSKDPPRYAYGSFQRPRPC